MFIEKRGGKKGNQKEKLQSDIHSFRLCVLHTLCSVGALILLNYEAYFPCQKYFNGCIIFHYLKLSLSSHFTDLQNIVRTSK